MQIKCFGVADDNKGGCVHHGYTGRIDVSIILEWLEIMQKESVVLNRAVTMFIFEKPFYTSKSGSGILCYNGKSGVPVEVKANGKQVTGEKGDFPSTSRNSFVLDLVELSQRYLNFAACLLVSVVLMTLCEESAKGVRERNAVTSLATQAAWYDTHLKDRFLHISSSKKWRMQEVVQVKVPIIANLMIEQLHDRCFPYAQEMTQPVLNLIRKRKDVYSMYRIQNVIFIAGRLSNREEDSAQISDNQARVLNLSSRVSMLEESSKTELVYDDSHDERMCCWKDWTESFPLGMFIQCDSKRQIKRSNRWYFGSILILVTLLPQAALLLHGNGNQSHLRKSKGKRSTCGTEHDSPYGSSIVLKLVVENEGNGKVKVYSRQLFWQEKKVLIEGSIWSKVLIGCFLWSQMYFGCFWLMMSRVEVMQEIQVVNLKLVTVLDAIEYLENSAQMKVYFRKGGSLWQEGKVHGLRIIEQGLCTRPVSNYKQEVVSLNYEFLERVGSSLNSKKLSTQPLNFRRMTRNIYLERIVDGEMPLFFFFKMQGESVGFWFKNSILVQTKPLHYEKEYRNLMYMLRIQPSYGVMESAAYGAMNGYTAISYGANVRYGAAPCGYGCSYAALDIVVHMEVDLAGSYGAASKARSANPGASGYPSGAGASNYGTTVWVSGATTGQKTPNTSEYSSHAYGQNGGSHASNPWGCAARGAAGYGASDGTAGAGGFADGYERWLWKYEIP